MTDDNIERPFKVVETGERCDTCAYFFNPAKADMGLCRRLPPTVLLVGAVQTIGGGSQAMTQSFYPPMGPEGWCGEYGPRSVEQVVSRNYGGLFKGTLAPIENIRDPDIRALYDRPQVFGGIGSLDPSKDVVEPVVAAGPEKPVTDPGGGGEDGGGH